MSVRFGFWFSGKVLENLNVERGKENSSEASYTITREKRAPNMGCEGGTKPTQVDASTKLLSKMLQHH